MKSAEIVTALAALAHEHRLGIYRLLVEAGPEGLPAGAIARELDLPASSLTFHVQNLHRASLVTQRRASRQLIYAADFAVMNALVRFLTENCCSRSSESCESPCKPPRARRGASRPRGARARIEVTS